MSVLLFRKFDIYMTFPRSTTQRHMAYHYHAVTFPMLFKNLAFTWDSLDNDVWYAITFPILFINLTFTWDSLWSRTHGMLMLFRNLTSTLVKVQSPFLNIDIYSIWDSQLFSYVKRCIYVKKWDTSGGFRLMERGSKWMVAIHCLGW